MTTEETPPALTPEQWAQLQHDRYWWEYHGPQQGGWSALPHLNNHRHGMAAACLYGQSFGFTQEDVDLVRYGLDVHSADDAEARNSLASRLAALLPPVQ